MTNWTDIKAEYVTTDIGYRELASKWGVSFTTLSRIAGKEKWPELRQQTTDKVTTEKIAAVAKQQIDRYTKMLEVTDKLLEKISESISMLEAQDIACDKSGIRALAGAIKDIKDIQSLKSDLDRAEQEARIEKLRKDASGEDKTNEVVVTIKGGDESWQG